MEANGGYISRITNDRDHLTAAIRPAEFDQLLEQKLSETSREESMMDVNRVFDREAIRGARAIAASVGVSGNHAIHFCDKVRKTVRQDFEATPVHFGGIGRIDLKRSGTSSDVVGVDFSDGCNVPFCCIPDERHYRAG
jgi:hypothetical protein